MKNLNFKVVDSNTLNYIALQEFIILKEKNLKNDWMKKINRSITTSLKKKFKINDKSFYY